MMMTMVDEAEPGAKISSDGVGRAMDARMALVTSRMTFDRCLSIEIYIYIYIGMWVTNDDHQVTFPCTLLSIYI